ncbi:MAG: ribonuclease P protein component 4 [Candidatus Sigynarchaeota archaeon]
MTKKYIKNKQKAGQIARERVDILMAAAEKAVSMPGNGPAMANRYVHIARKIAMKVRMPLDPQATRKICKKCNAFLLEGTTARVRLQGKGKNAHVVVTCLQCGNVKRYHYKRPRPGFLEG